MKLAPLVLVRPLVKQQMNCAVEQRSAGSAVRIGFSATSIDCSITELAFPLYPLGEFL